MSPTNAIDGILESSPSVWEITTSGEGPQGRLPLTAEMLLERPSGDIFGLTQNAGMGWDPRELGRPQYLILGTQGGVRAPDGRPIALGYHTGHWEVGLLMQSAAREFARHHCIPFAGFVTDPCDGRSQGTTAMFDSLPFRNDAATVLRRLIRSLPTRRGVLGVATCDKGLPAMMMALAGSRDLACVLVPGGVTLPAAEGEDAGRIQTIGVRFVHGELTLEQAAELGCRDDHPRGVRRLDQPDTSCAGDCACCRPPAADRAGLVAHQPTGPAHRRRPPQRAAQSSNRGGVSRGRRPRGDAAPATRGLAGRRSANGQRADPGRSTRRVGILGTARAAARRLARCAPVTRTTSGSN